MYPETLGTAHDAVVTSGSDMVIFDMQYDGEGFSWHEKSTIPDGVYESELILQKLAKASIPPYACNKFCRRSLYDGVFFPEGEKWEDVGTTFYPVSRAKKIAVLGKPLYHYRQRADAITKKASKDGSIHKWRFIQYRKRYEFLKANYSHLAYVSKEALLKNGLLYYAICLRNEEDTDTRLSVYKFLSSEDFDKDIKNAKLWLVREIFKLCPGIAAFLSGKRFVFKIL